MSRSLLIALMVAVAGAAEASAPPQAWHHLRCLTGASQRLAAGAAERSPLVAALIGELEQSDVIVYLDVVTSPPDGEFRASTTFVAWTGGMRYVLVQVDAYLTLPIEQIAMLGHELAHAVEVARAPQVHDAAGFRRLYGEIGTEWRPGHFETTNAQAAERRVRDEVLWNRPKHGGARPAMPRPPGHP